MTPQTYPLPHRTRWSLLTALVTVLLMLTTHHAIATQTVEVEKEDEDPVKVKENRLDKTKWEKKNYDSFVRRRLANNLPQELSLAPFNKLSSDPTLPHSDIGGYLNNPSVTTTIQLALKELSAPIPATLPDINILFAPTDETNATATGTGQIVVKAGVVKDLQYMDEVMFLLGHELAHIALDHFKNEETRQSLNALAVMATYAAKSGDRQRTERSDELIAALVFSEAILGPSWGRGDEREADELAIDMMVRTGYSTVGAQKVLNQLIKQELDQELERKKHCGKNNGVLHFLGLGAAPPRECDVVKKAFANLFSSHPTAEKRKEHLDKYLATRYPEYEPAVLRPLPADLSQFFSAESPLVRSAFAFKALRAFEQGHNEEAIRYAIASFDETDKSTPAPRFARYKHMKLLGKTEEARKQLRISYEQGTASRGMYMALLRETLAEASEIEARENAKSYENQYVALTNQYEGSPEKAAADAELAERARKDAELEAASQKKDKDEEEKPKAYAEATVAKFEEALDVIAKAKDQFPGRHNEFIHQEVDILYQLQRIGDLLTLLKSCRTSEDKILKEKCSATHKMITK